MKIRKIGFGQTKNLGNYQNQKLYLEAELEDWEDLSESLDFLRERVAEELDLGDRWRGLRAKAIREGAVLWAIENGIKFKQEKLDELERRYNALTEFLKRHGVNPETLVIEYYPAAADEPCEPKKDPQLVEAIKNHFEREGVDLDLDDDDDNDEDDTSSDWDNDWDNDDED